MFKVFAKRKYCLWFLTCWCSRLLVQWKAAYQEVAAQYGLQQTKHKSMPMTSYEDWAEAFAKVGHYLQIVDNKATALSGGLWPK